LLDLVKTILLTRSVYRMNFFRYSVLLFSDEKMRIPAQWVGVH